MHGCAEVVKDENGCAQKKVVNTFLARVQVYVCYLVP